MLAVKTYSPDHVARARAWARESAAAGGSGNALVLALDRWFVHRQRGLEGKDGNPINEVRLLCDSLVDHGGSFTVEGPVKWDPSRAVLGHAPGDPIDVNPEAFARLAEAFLAEIETRFA